MVMILGLLIFFLPHIFALVMKDLAGQIKKNSRGVCLDDAYLGVQRGWCHFTCRI